MHAGELRRLLEIARSFAPGHRIAIFGSASLLPKYPHLGEPGQVLSPSLDADFVIYGIADDLAVALIDAVELLSGILQRVDPKHEGKVAPEVGFEPTTNRLTADRSTTELLRIWPR